MALADGSGWRTPHLLDLDKSYDTHHSRAKGSNTQGPDTHCISRMPPAAQTVPTTCWHQKVRVKSCQGSSTGSFSSWPCGFYPSRANEPSPAVSGNLLRVLSVHMEVLAKYASCTHTPHRVCSRNFDCVPWELYPLKQFYRCLWASGTCHSSDNPFLTAECTVRAYLLQRQALHHSHCGLQPALLSEPSSVVCWLQIHLVQRTLVRTHGGMATVHITGLPRDGRKQANQVLCWKGRGHQNICQPLSALSDLTLVTSCETGLAHHHREVETPANYF